MFVPLPLALAKVTTFAIALRLCAMAELLTRSLVPSGQSRLPVALWVSFGLLTTRCACLLESELSGSADVFQEALIWAPWDDHADSWAPLLVAQEFSRLWTLVTSWALSSSICWGCPSPFPFWLPWLSQARSLALPHFAQAYGPLVLLRVTSSLVKAACSRGASL